MSKPRRVTQRDTNPFPHSDTNKRYFTFDYYLRKRFGSKCAKIPLDGGFTCPNIDGSRGVGGCIYCLGGSAAVTAAADDIEDQYADGMAAVSGKWRSFGTIPYLQSHTCTYGEPESLRLLYRRCAALPHAVMLAIATRADCLSPEICSVLRDISLEIPVLVELGLQSSNDRTAERINRCHTTAEFTEGYEMLRSVGGDISICVHLIDGLPGEGMEDMVESAEFVARLQPHMVKLHLLHVLKGTALFEMYLRGDYVPMEREEYIQIVCDQLELLPPDTVIARLTGDGLSEDLAAPAWSRGKMGILNDIDKELLVRGSYQGVRYTKTLG